MNKKNGYQFYIQRFLIVQGEFKAVFVQNRYTLYGKQVSP